MKNCLLLTSEFPFLNGEPFLSPELEYLKKAFDNITIFSINANQRTQATRIVPINCKIYSLGGTTSKLKYLEYLIRGVVAREKCFKTKNHSIKKLLASYYFRGRAKKVSESVLKIVDKEKIDIKDSIIYSFWFSYQAGAALLLKEHFEKQGIAVKSYSRAHGYDLYWERNSFNFQPYQDVLLKRLDSVFTCSEKGKNYLLDKYPWADEKIKVSRLGTNDNGITSYIKNKTIVTCCNLNTIKRMDLFAKAFCLLAKEELEARWICIGDGEQLPIVKNIICAHHLEKRVNFCGHLNQEEIIEIYKTKPIKYFCNVSTTEGVPVAIMEAQSFGIPVIATDVGGTSEIVNKENGYLLSPELDPISLSIALKEALNNNDASYLMLRKETRDNWEIKSSANNVYKEFLDHILGEKHE